MQRTDLLFFLVLMLFGFILNNRAIPSETPNVTTYTYSIVQEYPHDVNAYTQGLVYIDGFLYEGTGMKGESSLRKIDLQTGAVVQYHSLPREYFGEGIAVFNNKIVQLTWKSHTGFYYDRETFIQIEQFYYETEGWGLTYDGSRLIMSDGTETIRFLDSETFEELSRITVRDEKGPVEKLNELEYINGEVYANVWSTDIIVKFSPITGMVTGRINLEGLLQSEDQNHRIDVLNGIAYDAKNDRLFVTGKYWPKLFEIKLIPEG